MTAKDIENRLFELQDTKYRDFNSRSVPTAEKKSMIGVRTPELRKRAKEMAGQEGTRDFPECIAETERFLPYIDNWATCDQMNPKVFSGHHKELLPYTDRWLRSGKTYTVRFGIKMLMDHFLGEDFDIRFAERVAAVRPENTTQT